METIYSILSTTLYDPPLSSLVSLASAFLLFLFYLLLNKVSH